PIGCSRCRACRRRHSMSCGLTRRPRPSLRATSCRRAGGMWSRRLRWIRTSASATSPWRAWLATRSSCSEATSSPTKRPVLPAAKTTFKEMAALPRQAPNASASGLADLAAYEGRFKEAIQLLDEGAAADLKAKYADRAAAKFAEQAYVQLLRGQKAAAAAAAE